MWRATTWPFSACSMTLLVPPSHRPIVPSVLKKKVASAPARMSTSDECVTTKPNRAQPQGNRETMDARTFTAKSASRARNHGAKYTTRPATSTPACDSMM